MSPLYAPPARQPFHSLAEQGTILGASIDPAFATQATTVGSGILTLTQVPMLKAASVTNIVVRVTTLGSGLTSGQNLAGIYDSAGTLLASVADQSSTWTSTGDKTMALTGGPVTINPGSAGWVWVGILGKGTTVPIFLGYNATAGTIANIGLTVSTAVAATYSSALTALPSPVVPASNVLANGRIFAALT